MSQPNSAGGRKCVRCQQPLPADTTFCIGCGQQNASDELIGRQLGIENELERRRGNTSFWNQVISFFTGWWRTR